MKSTTSNQKLYVSNTFYNNEKRNSYLVTSLTFYEKFRYANVIMFSNVFLTFTDDYLSGPFPALGERKWEQRWLLNFRILWEIEGGLVGTILGLYDFFKNFCWKCWSPRWHYVIYSVMQIIYSVIQIIAHSKKNTSSVRLCRRKKTRIKCSRDWNYLTGPYWYSLRELKLWF